MRVDADNLTLLYSEFADYLEGETSSVPGTPRYEIKVWLPIVDTFRTLYTTQPIAFTGLSAL